MNNDTKNNFFKQGFLFFSSVNSDFKFILDVATDLLDKHPEILNRIKKDQNKQLPSLMLILFPEILVICF